MSPDNQIPPAKDTTIADASALVADQATINKNQAALSAVGRYLAHKNRSNTPFDGRKRKIKVAKARAARKANKRRKLYIRYGVQSKSK